MLIKKKWFIIGLNWNHWTDFAKFPPLSAQPAANSPSQCPVDNVPVCSGHREFQCGFIQARAPDSYLPASWREKNLVHSLPHQNLHWRSLAVGAWPIGCSLWGCESWINASNIAVQWLLTGLLCAVALTTVPAASPRLAPAHIPSHGLSPPVDLPHPFRKSKVVSAACIQEHGLIRQAPHSLPSFLALEESPTAIPLTSMLTIPVFISL